MLPCSSSCCKLLKQQEQNARAAPGPAPVVAVVGQRQLGPQQQHAPVQQVCAAVVAHAAVDDRHAHVAQDAVRGIAGQQFGQALPAVLDGVQLLKVVLAAIAGHLQLRPAHEACPQAVSLRSALMCSGLTNLCQAAAVWRRYCKSVCHEIRLLGVSAVCTIFAEHL